jgi:hypothetical protein
MPTAQKPVIKLGNVELAASSGIAWRYISGVAPYTTIMSVHRSQWSRLQVRIGKPLELEITDSRGVKTKIEQVYILHLAPSDSPHRVSFVVADKRWLWPYKLVVRDFNMPRKTGDRTALGQSVPVETQQVVDQYDFLTYSLQPPQNTKWTAQTALEAVLELVDGDGYEVESWPIKDTTGVGDSGQFSLQGVTLRDSGDVALQRLLSYIPGAEIYINAKGQTVIFDASDLDATESHFRTLPLSTYAGERGAWVDRKAIRPSKVIVHYQKEIELLIDYADDYSGQTSAAPLSNFVYADNVIPTTDPETLIVEWDPVQNEYVGKRVPMGTYVRVDTWLDAMDAIRPLDGLPWTWDTIKTHWFKGDLDAVWVRGKDLDPVGNVAMRLQAFRQHFRQTFRINRKYMERIRNLRPMRVAMLDPVTGARAPAAVWGQGCIVPSQKGHLMARRSSDERATSKYLRNVDYLNPYYADNVPLLKVAPGPQRVNIIDEEQGIFRLEWIVSPYGIVDSFLPCKLVDENGNDGISTSRDLKYQEDTPMGAGMIIEGGTNGIFLDDKLEAKILLTAVPSSPNSRQQFHQIEVEARDIQSLFQREFRIQDGEGPPLEVFVSPGEVTARFGMTDAAEAANSQQILFGLTSVNEGEIPTGVPGYTLINEQRELIPHARSLAAEVIAPFADNVQGVINTSIPRDGVKLVGNMNSATIRVAAAPSARVDAVHEFPGQQRSIPRHALMPESARQLILGIVPFKA